MNTRYLLTAVACMLCMRAPSQKKWEPAVVPQVLSRIDDVFMTDPETGYAVCGDGKIMKTEDSAKSWKVLAYDSLIYYRSVEFFNRDIGFVGGFSYSPSPDRILNLTTDGGKSWTDITSRLKPGARKGICGLAAAGGVIYGCGVWYGDSAYMVRSDDTGKTWKYIPMGSYASALIDIHFNGRDTGYATGSSRFPEKRPVIFYTTDGGGTWAEKYLDTRVPGYVWKIQKLNDSIYYASIEDLMLGAPHYLRSTDGGMSWVLHRIDTEGYDLEGIGFMDNQTGWAGGDFNHSYQTVDGGLTWQRFTTCRKLNRVLKVSNTFMVASGAGIYRYTRDVADTDLPEDQVRPVIFICSPNPVSVNFRIRLSLPEITHLQIMLFSEKGQLVKTVCNQVAISGDHVMTVNTEELPSGKYYVLLKTHDQKMISQILIVRE